MYVTFYITNEVACVQPEIKTRSFFARNLTSFALCYYVISLFKRVQTNQNTKGKECGSVVSSRFFGGEHCVTSQKTAAEEMKAGQDVWKKIPASRN